jgi:DNA-binding MarR family transcriptional regulator
MRVAASVRNPDENRLIEGLFAIERELRSLLDARLAIEGITTAQFSVLRFIDAPFDKEGKDLGREPNASDIADHFGFANRTVTVAVNTLVAKGWLSRSTSASDRRVKYLALTPHGRAKLAKALQLYSPINSIFHRLPRQQELSVIFAIPRLLDGIRAMQRAERIRSKKSRSRVTQQSTRSPG